MNSQPYIITPEIEQILSVHTQLWDGKHTITYKDQTEQSYVPPHKGYRSVILKNSTGVPHMWITQNMNKSTYGTYAIERAARNNERLRITWIVNISNNQYIYSGRIETHEYNNGQQDIVRIETYRDNETNVVYDNNPSARIYTSIV